MIVDTHTHIVSADAQAYPLTPRSLSGEWYLASPCTAEGLIEAMDASGVDRAVLVQPVGAYSYDNRYTADSARAHPERFVSACCIDAEGESSLEELSYWIRERGMHGVRLFALSQERSWLAEARTLPLWEHAAKLGAHVIVTIFASQLPELREVLVRYPEIPISLDHCAFPDVTAPDSLFELAAFPNLHLKVSTHVLDAAVASEGDATGFVGRLVAAFGSDRIMWGSDFCQTHDRTYLELAQLGRTAFSALPTQDQAACLGGTALRLWPALSE